jgi:RNA polymerase sigma-70 factor (ECF subfamily)
VRGCPAFPEKQCTGASAPSKTPYHFSVLSQTNSIGQRGTKAGLSRLVAPTCRHLFQGSPRLCQDRGRSGGSFQDILLQVWRSVSAFRHEASASTWLYRIALNVAIKWRTKENRRLEETSNSSLLLPGKNYQNPQLEWLYQAIHRLPKIDRSLILLHLDGFPHAEIGSITGMSTTNVGTRLHRIKQQLATAARQTKAHEL